MSKTRKPPPDKRAAQIETWRKRREAICAHHEAGWSYTQIGREFGISRNRVAQIVAAWAP